MKMKNKTNNHRSEEGRSRRSFLSVVWGGLGLVAVAEFVWIGASFFKPRKSQKRAASGEVIEAGAVEDFTPGSVKAFRQGGFYLLRLEDGGFLALSSRCTHLGCIVSWNPTTRLFECPCHSSAFDLRGEVKRPSAPRPLDYFKVIIERQTVKVLTGQRMKRDQFNHRQVTSALKNGNLQD